jgi:phage tail sheath protein FI
MFGGGVNIVDPRTNQEISITELGDVFAAMTKRSNENFEWFTFAGSKRGRITGVLGVTKDYGSPALKATADQLYLNQINLTIDHESFGPVIWGNRTMQKANTLLKYANVAELVLFISRNCKPISDAETFDPNDIETWRVIHKGVTKFLDYVKDNRGVWNYIYDGDQDIDNISQAVVNTSANIDAGQYIFKLAISPKVGMEYVNMQIAVTNSDVIVTLL